MRMVAEATWAPVRIAAPTAHVMQVVLRMTPGGTERLVLEICKRVREDFMRFAWVNDVLRAGMRTLLDSRTAAAHSA